MKQVIHFWGIWRALLVAGVMLGFSIAFPPIGVAGAASSNQPPWVREIVDAEGDVGRLSFLQVDAQDQTHIVYFDASRLALKYAHQQGVDWHISTVATFSGPINSLALALDAQSGPYIAYSDGQAVYTITPLGQGWQRSLVFQQSGYPGRLCGAGAGHR